MKVELSITYGAVVKARHRRKLDSSGHKLSLEILVRGGIIETTKTKKIKAKPKQKE